MLLCDRCNRVYHTRCLVPALPGAGAALCRRCLVCLISLGLPWLCPCADPAGSLPACPRLPRAAAYDDVACQVCVLDSKVKSRCCCAIAATGGFTCSALPCASSACPLGTGSARLVLDPLLTILLPLLATLAAAQGPSCTCWGWLVAACTLPHSSWGGGLRRTASAAGSASLLASRMKVRHPHQHQHPGPLGLAGRRGGFRVVARSGLTVTLSPFTVETCLRFTAN
jgi:hypothetical protein